LQRAVLLYGKVAKRRKEIDRERRPVEPGWRARWRSRARFRKKFGKELEELEIYARDLRSTILRLRRRPIRHCKRWIHVISAKPVVGALACYSLALAALVVFCHYAEPPPSTLGISIRFDTFLLWQPLEGRLLLLNWMAANLVAVAVPVFYVNLSACTEQSRHFRLDGLRQQRSRAVAQNLGQRIGKSSWLGELENVSVGHSVSLLQWRSGGVEHPHDTPPYPLMPSPTFANSSG
jgi:hypothetical protein